MSSSLKLGILDLFHWDPGANSSLSLLPGTQFWRTRGARVAFDVTVPDGAVGCLVLVNGFQRPRADYRAFRKRLSLSFPNLATLSLDNRGVADTELFPEEDPSPEAIDQCGIGNWGVRRMAQDVIELSHWFQMQSGLKSSAVLGISMGGMIAQTACLADPNLFQGMVLVSTTAGGQSRTWPALKEGSSGFSRKEFVPWPTDYESMHERMSRYFGARFARENPFLIEVMSKNMISSRNGQGSDSGSRFQFAAARDFAAEDLLRDLKIPALILTGDEDSVIPPENSQTLKKLIPKSHLKVYDEVGHLILAEAPERFEKDVAEFLGEVCQWNNAKRPV